MPLREGGSLPGLVEADDDGMYVVKFRGAGQGSGALVAEIVAGEIARLLGLPVPELVFIDIDPLLGRSEPDGEVQALIHHSAGQNIACDFLPGALPFDGAMSGEIDPLLASKVVWFDAFVTNIDRTARNTNMLWWHRQLHMIDHGASLFVMHAWDGYESRIRSPFSAIKDHVLLRSATQIAVIDADMAAMLTPERLSQICQLVPEAWWPLGQRWQHAEQAQSALLAYLTGRLTAPRPFVDEVLRARTSFV
ncbi:MAG: aminotransferase class I and II [Chloroflexi bacterium]|nr:aminotransferase class I and II [Chloroflexota bacterium]